MDVIKPLEGSRQFPVCIIWAFHLEIHFLRTVLFCAFYGDSSSWKGFFGESEEKPFSKPADRNTKWHNFFGK